MKNFIERSGWILVLGAALGVSAWSLFYISRHLGAPLGIALVVSTCFDGVALLCAHYAIKSVKAGDSGVAARFGMLIFTGASAYANSRHAVLVGQPQWAGFLWAIPPVSAAYVFEIHTRYEKRAALARQNKSLPPLPAMGLLAWVLSFWPTLTAFRRLIGYRRERILTLYAPEAFPANRRQLRDSSTRAIESSETDRDSSEFESETFQVYSIVPTSEIRTWAKARGIRVNERGSLPADVLNQYYAEQNQGGKAAGNE